MASTGTTGLVLTGVSIACTIAVGAAGTSLMEPPLPGVSSASGVSGVSGALGQLPWSVDLRPSPYLAVGLAAVGLAAGTLGLALTLRALRAGWRINPRTILLAGAAAAIVAGTTRPFGSSDFLSYAAYGRELATGHNPYAVAPAALARLGDPVARAVQDWAGTPSVYGALASGVFGFASLVGGTSARLTVFVLDLVNAAAFVATGLLLDRLARDRLAARLRAAVLWTCNPLLLQILVAGGHVDALAVAFGVAGIAVAAPAVSASRVAGAASRGVAAGALIGLGFAVKPTIVLIGIGIAIAAVIAAPSALSASSASFSVRNTANVLRSRSLFRVSAAITTMVFRIYRVVRSRPPVPPPFMPARGCPGKAEVMITGCSPRYSRVTTRDHGTAVPCRRRTGTGIAGQKGSIRAACLRPAVLARTRVRETSPGDHTRHPNPETAKHQAAETRNKSAGQRPPQVVGRSRDVICGLLAGFTMMAATDLVLIGRAGIAQTLRASGMVSVGSPWRVVRTVLSQFMAEPVADEVVRDGAVVLALLLAAGFLRQQHRAASPDTDKSGAGMVGARIGAGMVGEQARDGETGAERVQNGATLTGRAAFALVLAWLVAWPYVLPWYDALAWALLPLLPASGFDWALFARTAVLGFGYLPARSAGITIPSGLRWMEPVIRSAATPAVLAAVAVFLVFVTLRRAWLASFYRE